MNFSFAFYRYALEPGMRFFVQFLRPVLPQKIRRIIQLKNELPQKLSALNFSASPFWIHASSGEVEYAKPVIRELKKNFPEVPILVTFSSVSAIPLLKNLSEVDHYCVLPWDTQSAVRLFLDKVRPRLLLIARTDVWPEIMEQVHLKKIPSLLFSGTLSEASGRTRGLAGALSRKSFQELSQIFCVSEKDRAVFHKLQSGLSLKVTGDTRFEQVLERLRQPQSSLKENLRPVANEKVLVAGSTWPEDDQILFRVLKQNLDVRCIWAPHEMDRASIESLTKDLRKKDLTFCLYSQSETWSPQTQILVIDEVGILADLYSWGRVAFVGGSFRGKVHSVMEPLAAGKPVIVGPYFENNREAQEFSLIRFQVKKAPSLEAVEPLSLVNRVLNSRQFNHQLLQLLNLNEASSKDLNNLIVREVQKRVGATQSVTQWVMSMSQ